MAELYNFGSGAWTTASEYPFGSKPYLSLYDMVFVREILSYLVIGGMSGEDLSQIARFTNGAWYDAGQLYKARGVRESPLFFDSKLSAKIKTLQAQWFNNALVVAGGMGELSTETCSLNDSTGKFECVDITPTLDKYTRGVSFVVSIDYCA